MLLRQQFYYMFPISLAIIITSILLAFSSSSFFSAIFSLLYALISYPINTTLTYIFTTSGLYSLSRDLSQKANWLRERERNNKATMKANVLREKMEDGGLREMRKIVGEGATEMQEIGKGLGKGAKGAGKKVWGLGRGKKKGDGVDLEDVERHGTGGSSQELYYSKPT